MDIGSKICVPKHPKCNICPLNQKCIARLEEKWEKYPLKNIKKIYLKKESWFIIIQLNNTFWMEKNIQNKIWNNLFCFPRFDNEILALNWLEEKKINIKKYEKIAPFFHKFSHFILQIHPVLIKLSCILNLYTQNNTGLWYDLKNPQNIGLPQPVQKIIKIFQKDTFKNKEY